MKTIHEQTKQKADNNHISATMNTLQKALDSMKVRNTKTFTLFLIRHGEASHNIEEKIASEKAKDEAIQDGLSLDDSELLRRMEQARVQVLDDPRLFDAPLTDRGREEAVQCQAQLQSLGAKFSRPTQVLVSPLQRALQTADLVFPDHTSIHVRDELRERMTGHACDTRNHSHALRKRKSFQRFSMRRLQLGSILHRRSMPPVVMNDEDEDSIELDVRSVTNAGHLMSSAPTLNASEDSTKLRERTKLLFDMLLESEDTSIAVVSHKGYLRELERGQFGLMDSPLYRNCEVRVYEVKISTRSKKLIHAKRLA
jgi:broad specificity phosphatase PhoE